MAKAIFRLKSKIFPFDEVLKQRANTSIEEGDILIKEMKTSIQRAKIEIEKMKKTLVTPDMLEEQTAALEARVTESTENLDAQVARIQALEEIMEKMMRLSPAAQEQYGAPTTNASSASAAPFAAFMPPPSSTQKRSSMRKIKEPPLQNKSPKQLPIFSM